MKDLPPSVVLEGRALETLEVILGGLLGDVDGYRLPGESPAGWPVEPTLRVSRAVAERLAVGSSLELRDPDTTPLARLSVTEVLVEDDAAWLAGDITPLRAAEHGPFRSRRLPAGTNLSEARVVMCGGALSPAGVLRIVQGSDARPLVLVVTDRGEPSASSTLVGQLDELARLLPGTRVSYLPEIDEGRDDGVDVAVLMLQRLGAEDILDLRLPRTVRSGGAVMLLTGLSGSGKSTIARALTDRLRESGERKVVLLDGDHVRAELASELGFGAEDRDRNLRRQAWVAARVAEAGGLAICAPIAPFAASRQGMREKVEPDHPFLIVYVSTPIAVAEARDRKGLYAKARAGLISDFTGIDSPYEIPTDADLVLDASVLSVDSCVDAAIELLRERAVLSS